MEDTQALKKKFHNDPTINPRTNKKLIKDKGPYNKLVEEFGLPYKKDKKSKKSNKSTIQNRLNESTILNQILPEDMIYQIMVKSDINTLKKLCIVNKQNEKICQTEQFWKAKFHNDDLPFLKFIQYELKDYKNAFMFDNNIKTWIKIYEEMKDAQKEAKEILLVNKIEKKRLNYKTKGIIMIDLTKQYEEIQLFYFLPKVLLDKIAEDDISLEKFDIQLLDANNYNITLHIYNIETEEIITIESIVNEKVVEDVLTLYLFNSFTFYDIPEIVDDRGFDFRYGQTELNPNAPTTLKLRFNTYETIKIMEQL